MTTREEFKKLLKTKDNYKIALNTILEKIKTLEKIYQTGGQTFSEHFEKEAEIERNNLCKETTTLYALLREKEGSSK